MSNTKVLSFTWESALPILVHCAHKDDIKIKQEAWKELTKMAQAADKYNELIDKHDALVKEYEKSNKK